MIFNKEKRRIIKKAKIKAREEYEKSIKREKAKKDFLERPDDFDFYAELLKGIAVNPALKIIVEKSNGTKIILKLSEEIEKSNKPSDWIDFDSLVTSNNEVGIK